MFQQHVAKLVIKTNEFKIMFLRISLKFYLEDINACYKHIYLSGTQFITWFSECHTASATCC